MVKENFGIIRNRFKILLAEKEHREARSLPYTVIQQETGIATSTLSAWAGQRTARFDAPTLAALCAYFDCQPGDLLEFVPSEQIAKGKGRGN
jgi:putative transcriptional regulator